MQRASTAGKSLADLRCVSVSQVLDHVTASARAGKCSRLADCLVAVEVRRLRVEFNGYAWVVRIGGEFCFHGYSPVRPLWALVVVMRILCKKGYKNHRLQVVSLLLKARSIQQAPRRPALRLASCIQC